MSNHLRGQLFISINRLLRRSFDAEFKARFGDEISANDSWGLRHLKEINGCTFSELGKALRINKSSTSELVSSWQQKGLIDVVSDEKDKRRKLLFLTSKGEETIEATKTLLEAHDARLFAEVTPDELAVIERIYEKLVQQEGGEEYGRRSHHSDNG